MTRALLLLLAVTACANPLPPACREWRASLKGRGVPTLIIDGNSPQRFGFPWEACEVRDGQALCWSRGFEVVKECAMPADGGAP